MQAAIESLKTALEGSDVDAIKAQTETLQTASYKLAEIVYADAQTAADGAEGAAGTTSAADDAVVEADYEVVDADDKDN